MSRLVFLTFAIFVQGLAHADSAEVKESKAGWFYQEVDVVSDIAIRYMVDTTTQLCFIATFRNVGGTSVLQIPCATLAKRPEWRSIISWETPSTSP
jgi:hypothetical protein